ncbi:hypothetical protein EVAR_57895_1 [Eumeta japonica]|uniref:Uncharacterized protein n=1 Tax=Eumeta variegata TaxID=151549 RepID=A0A4C1YVV4_EUMVA|nr:hypothetical protein EVAR_57895_1 [Eumeta japonica]
MIGAATRRSAPERRRHQNEYDGSTTNSAGLSTYPRLTAEFRIDEQPGSIKKVYAAACEILHTSKPSIHKVASFITTMALEFKTMLVVLTKINKVVKEAVISKLSAICNLAIRIKESRSRIAAELEPERVGKSQEIAALECQQWQYPE